MEAKPPAPDTERGVTRRELEAIIRRAAELYAAEAESDDRISEDELLRIAAELGLPARYVRQALYERPAAEEPSFLDRTCGPPSISASRALPVEPAPTLARLEEYLTTREYLQIRRRQGDRLWLVPADDPITRLFRVFSRPAGRYHLARAHGVGVAVQPLEPGWAHIRIEVDLSTQRKDTVTSASVLGGVFGSLVGIGIGAVVGEVAGDALGDPIGVAAGIAAFVGTVATSASAAFAIAATRFRRRLAAAKQEVEALLDRIQLGERLDPPPAPWRRRLHARFSGLHPER